MLEGLGVKVRINEVARTKEYLGVPYDASTVVLTVEGLENVFESLFPLLLTPQGSSGVRRDPPGLKDFWYWKESQLSIFSTVKEYYAIKAHRLVQGLTLLVMFLFSVPNLVDNDKRTVTLSSCLEAIKNMEESKNNRSTAGHYMIASELNSSGVLIYRVRFPSFMFETRKSYIFSTNGNNSAEALKSAVDFRDSTINDWLRSKLT